MAKPLYVYWKITTQIKFSMKNWQQNLQCFKGEVDETNYPAHLNDHVLFFLFVYKKDWNALEALIQNTGTVIDP